MTFGLLYELAGSPSFGQHLASVHHPSAITVYVFKDFVLKYSADSDIIHRLVLDIGTAFQDLTKFY